MPRPLSGRRLVRILTRLIVLGGVVVIAAGAYATYRVLDQASRDERRPADAIVVMGAAQYDGTPSPVFAARIDHAIDLFRDGVAPVLVVTGGKQEGDRTTEAASARAYAIEHGVPADAILTEDASRTTYESIQGVAAVMADNDLSSAVFVSDPSHMFRVLWMARDAGIDAYGSPTTTSPVERDPVARLDAVVHELGAIAVHLISGRSP